MKKSYRSKIAAAVHETMSDMHEAGLISKATMRVSEREHGGKTPSGPSLKLRSLVRAFKIDC